MEGELLLHKKNKIVSQPSLWTQASFAQEISKQLPVIVEINTLTLQTQTLIFVLQPLLVLSTLMNSLLGLKVLLNAGVEKFIMLTVWPMPTKIHNLRNSNFVSDILLLIS